MAKQRTQEVSHKLMLISTEMRWFYPGVVPEAIAHWFASHYPQETTGSPETRTDVYLYTPGCDYLNLKLRQGKLEIKWRKQELGQQTFNNWQGYGEEWLKWICTDESMETLSPPRSMSGSWLSVEKTRSLHRYEYHSDRLITPIAHNQVIPQGCNAELTHLRVNGHPWWSFALEAFGPENCLGTILSVSATEISAIEGGPKLDLVYSYGYPQWLSLVAQGERN